MFAIISILFVAPPDINTLMLSYSIQSLVVVAGAGSEGLYAANKRSWAKYAYFATLLLFAVPWIGLFLTFGIAVGAKPTEDRCGVEFPVGTEKKTPPDFVWGAILGLFFTFSSFAVVHAFKIYQGTLEFYSHLKYEFVYSFLSFSSKIILLGNVASGIFARSDNNIKTADLFTNVTASEFFEEEKEEGDSSMFWGFLGGSVGLALILGTAMLWSVWGLLGKPKLTQKKLGKLLF